MSEENNFLEEMEETLEEAASVETEEPRTPIEDFAFWLWDLSGCASHKANIVSLDRTKADVTAADASEAFQSKAKCRSTAQKRLDRAIQEAGRRMEACMSASGNSGMVQEFRHRFDNRLNALREKLKLLRTPENSAVVDEMERYMAASGIHNKAKEVCNSLTEKYRLQKNSTYYSAIGYDTWDPSDFETGVAKLFAKGFVRYGFNCYDAIRAVEEDAQTALNGFQEDFNTQMQDEILESIVEPVQALLPQLRDSEVLQSA